MFKVGDVIVCIDDKPKSKYNFFDFVSFIILECKINPLTKYNFYTIKEIHTYWGDNGNCYDSIDDTSSRYDNTSYMLEEVDKIYDYVFFDMNRLIHIKEYRKLKLEKLNEK